MLAKLYGPDDDQVLVIRCVGPSGQPVINYDFEAYTYVGAEEKGLMVVQHTYSDVAVRDAAFDAMTEDAARQAVAEGRAQLELQLAAEREKLS